MTTKKPSKPASQVPSSTGKRVRTLDRAYAPSINRTELVVKALENPKFKWRTVQGVAKEAGIDEPTARRLISDLGENVVKSRVASKSGEDLYTTRRHYRESESFLGRIAAILRNRAT